MHQVTTCGRIPAVQALKTRVACEPPWKMACSLVSTYFQRSVLEDFYRRQNDIIDSLMEVITRCAVHSALVEWRLSPGWQHTTHPMNGLSAPLRAPTGTLAAQQARLRLRCI